MKNLHPSKPVAAKNEFAVNGCCLIEAKMPAHCIERCDDVLQCLCIIVVY